MSTPEEVPIVETSLEDDLRAAFAEAREEAPETLPVVDNTETAREEGEPTETRDRDEHGRFKAKEPVPEAEAGATIEAPEPETPATPDPYGLAPQYAGPAIKAQWGKLPPAVREEIVKRDREVHQTFTRFDEDRNFGKATKEVVAPYEAIIKQLGAEPIQAIKYLLESDYALRTGSPDQKRALFEKLVRDYGVDLGNGAQPPAPQIDPAIETMQQRIARLEAEQNAAMSRGREEAQRSIDSQIADFASRPENVYFERVKPVMATLLQSGQADSLEKAYDMAIYADPDTRALHLAAQRDAEDRKRTAERTAQAQRARQASPSITGAPGSTMQAPLNGSSHASVEDDVRAAISAVAGRA